MRRDLTTNDPFKRGAVWRGVVGCVVAYALVITALLTSVLQAEWGEQALAGAHCMTGTGAGSDGQPGDGSQPDDGSHCPLCTLAAGPAVLPVAPGIAWNVVAVAGPLVSHGGFDWIPGRGHPARLPRGPPTSAV